MYLEDAIEQGIDVLQDFDVYSYTVKRDWLREYKSTRSCSRCDESHSACLDFHHRNPKSKELTVALMVSRYDYHLRDLQEEVDKCELICSNCHRKIHFKDYTED